MTTPIAAAEHLRIRWLGRLAYDEAWDLQKAFHEGRVTGRSRDDYLLLVEHPHTYTVGRNGDGSNLLVDPGRLETLGATLHAVDRGGDITYHGPGQLVGYPIVAVPRLPRGFDMVGHVRRIEQMLIATLADLGVTAWAEEGYTGVWTAQGKVAAIGVRVSGGVAMHGFALNVDPDLDYFGHMIPCGIPDRPVTSLRRLLGRDVSLEEVVEALLPHAAATFPAPAVETQLGAFARGQGRRYDVDAMVAAGVFSAESRNEISITIRGVLAGEPQRPDWMKVTAATTDPGYQEVASIMREQGLNTVCEEAGCPNIHECWSQGTATLMLLGDLCTRACAFCDVKTGRPGDVDREEPGRAAAAVAAMGLKHAVLTSVNRDDLDDGGASIFAETIGAIRRLVPDCDVEVLIPDFKGDEEALRIVMGEKPSVLNHNTETVLRLQRDIRTAANYGRSLALLARARWINPAGTVKSGLIVGMGEKEGEILGALADLRAVGVDIVTIGQYLRPTPRHRPIDRYVHPDEFARYTDEGSGSVSRTSRRARWCARRTTPATRSRPRSERTLMIDIGYPDADYGARLARARTTMSSRGVDALVLSVGRDLPYLLGYEAPQSERLTMAIVTRDAIPVLVLPQLEAPRVDTRGGIFDVVAWSETEDPVAIVASHLGGAATVAVGSETWATFVLRLNETGDRDLVDAAPLMRELRIVKDRDELAMLRAAGAAVDRVVDRIATMSFTGRAESDLARKIADMTVEGGHQVATFTVVAAGPNAASPHHESGSRPIGPGDTIVIDFGGRWHGYASDTSRTFVVGEPSVEVAAAHAVLFEAQQTGVAAVRPGVPASQIDRVTRDVIDAAGYGEYFVHRTGHGVGLDAHEHPYIVAGNDTILEAGMAFSVEPGIYMPGEWGMRIEDLVAVTDDGVETFNDSDRSLVVVD